MTAAPTPAAPAKPARSGLRKRASAVRAGVARRARRLTRTSTRGLRRAGGWLGRVASFAAANWGLLLATAVSAALVLAVGVLALPGSPRHWSHGFESGMQKPLVVAALAALVSSALLWTTRAWVLRKRLRD